MEDGTVIDTANATLWWEETSDWNGSNHIGRSSSSQWHDQMLFRSRRGRYYVEHTSRVQGERDWCEWVSKEEACRWLVLNEHDLPDDLKEAEQNVIE
jgi:hypothetical protein